MFLLAGHLGMTVKELEARMDSNELSEWMAMHRYYHAIPDLNRSLALLTSAVIAGYARRGNVPPPSRFMGLEPPPRHPIQDREQVESLAREFGEWQPASD